MNQNVEEYQNVSPKLVDLMFKCLEIDIEKRINVDQLVEELSKIGNLTNSTENFRTKFSNSLKKSTTPPISNLKISDVNDDNLFSTEGGYPSAYDDLSIDNLSTDSNQSISNSGYLSSSNFPKNVDDTPYTNDDSELILIQK